MSNHNKPGIKVQDLRTKKDAKGGYTPPTTTDTTTKDPIKYPITTTTTTTKDPLAPTTTTTATKDPYYPTKP